MKDLLWRQVRSMKRAKGSGYASVGRDGRMILPRPIVDLAGLKPGSFVELFTSYDEEQNLWIAVEPKSQETAWTVRCTCTGKNDDWGKPNTGKSLNLIVPLQTALSMEGIRLVRVRRVESSWEPDQGRILIQFGPTQAVGGEAVVPE